jgi:membrane peptidoglycan carboxypeptidase
VTGKRKASGARRSATNGGTVGRPNAGKAPAGKAPTGQAGSAPKGRHPRLRKTAKWAGITGLVLALLAVAGFTVLYQAIDVPDPNEDFETQTSFVYYADGKTQLGRYATQNRDSISYDEMPQTVKDAVVAAENRSFWTDKGLDPKGIVRAAFSNAQGNSQQGASTITQQYVKILYLTQERSYKRKMKEAIVSLKLQRQQSKQQILEGYLNTIYFGRGAYGIEAAAHAFFDKPAKKLNLRQSAVLASVINNPTRFDPANGKDNREALLERYQYVLSGMASMGTADADQADKAQQRLPKFPKVEAESAYAGQKGFMLDMIKKELLRLDFSEQEINGGGLRVYTTLSRKAMDAAREGVDEAKPKGKKGLHVAVASVQPGTGALRGFYAGQDYLDSQINWATAGGSPGSSFKPFALAAGIDAGYSLKDTFQGNSPYEYPGGDTVRNEGVGPDGLGNDYGAAINMIKATEESVNTAYADLTESIPDGPDKILDMANKLGIPRWDKSRSGMDHLRTSPGLQPTSGIALGYATVSPINMANAYGSIANGGKAAPVYLIDKVVDESGEVRYRHKVSTERALDEDKAADVSYAMQQVVQNGTGANAQVLGRPAAGKTGTATNDDDKVSSSWFVGYTPQMATAVMYVRGSGNESLEGFLEPFYGATYPTQTWTAVMRRLMEGEPVESFPEPAYVDGDAPEEGHAPYTPPPKPTKKPKPTKTETPSPTPTPTETPTETPTAPTPPTPSCPVLDPNCDSESPTPSPGGPSSPGGGNGNGGNGAAASREERAYRE